MILKQEQTHNGKAGADSIGLLY
ncbi:hypothetical protein, partial [Bacillus pumilus]